MLQNTSVKNQGIALFPMRYLLICQQPRSYAQFVLDYPQLQSEPEPEPELGLCKVIVALKLCFTKLTALKSPESLYFRSLFFYVADPESKNAPQHVGKEFGHKLLLFPYTLVPLIIFEDKHQLWYVRTQLFMAKKRGVHENVRLRRVKTEGFF